MFTKFSSVLALIILTGSQVMGEVNAPHDQGGGEDFLLAVRKANCNNLASYMADIYNDRRNEGVPKSLIDRALESVRPASRPNMHRFQVDIVNMIYGLPLHTDDDKHEASVSILVERVFEICFTQWETLNIPAPTN